MYRSHIYLLVTEANARGVWEKAKIDNIRIEAGAKSEYMKEKASIWNAHMNRAEVAYEHACRRARDGFCLFFHIDLPILLAALSDDEASIQIDD